MAELLREIGDQASGRQECNKALSISSTLVKDYPNEKGYLYGLTASHHQLGRVCQALGDQLGARAHYEQALAGGTKLVAHFPENSATQGNLANFHGSLGNLLAEVDAEAAKDHYQRALASRSKLVAKFPSVVEHRRDLVETHLNLAALLEKLGDKDSAQNQHKNALAIQSQLVADFPNELSYRKDLASIQYSLGVLETKSANIPKALVAYKEALATVTQLATQNPTDLDQREKSDHRRDMNAAIRGQGTDLMAPNERGNPLRSSLSSNLRQVNGASEVSMVDREKLEASAMQPPISILRQKLGENVTVEFSIVQINSADNVMYVSSTTDRRLDSLSIILDESQADELVKGSGFKYLNDFLDRRIRITGKIEERSKKLQICVDDPADQIEILATDGQWFRPRVKQKATTLQGLVTPAIGELRAVVGQQRTVEFRVLNVGGVSRVYMNSMRNHRHSNCFSAVVESHQRKQFDSLGIRNPALQLPGKLVRVTGKVEEQDGQVKIRIRDLATQLKIIDAAELTAEQL
jgi:tetratricopeptide (TPR) repeat protein